MSSTLALIREHGLLAVIDAPIEERVFDWAMAVSKGGIELLGIPVTLGNVTEIVSDLGDAELTVGITGVVQAEQVSIAVAAGAEFLISPVVDEEIIATTRRRPARRFGRSARVSRSGPSALTAITVSRS